MKTFKTIIKEIFKHFYNTYATAEKINNAEDYEKQKAWLTKIKRLYKWSIIIAIVGAIIGVLFISKITEVNILICVLFSVLFMPFMFLCFWGYASMGLYFKPMIKSIWNATKFGYKTGEKIKETHITVSHEFGNTYKVSSHETDKGVLFAYIMSAVCFFGWVVFCVYVAPFLTYKKAKNTIKSLKEYEKVR